MSSLFPLREVKHEMYSRNKVKFVENRVKSVRYKNSSVPHMQHATSAEWRYSIWRKILKNVVKKQI